MNSKVIVKVNVSDMYTFLLRMNNKKIPIFYVNGNIIKIYYDDYIKLKDKYDIEVYKYCGIRMIYYLFLDNIYLFLFGLLSIISIFIYSNMITKVEVISNDYAFVSRLEESLKRYKISNYQMKKSYDYLSKVKDNLLEEYHNEIEWIEIENIGTHYLVRYEPRIIKDNKKDNNKYNIVSGYDAIIKNILVSHGEILKWNNEYVSKGDMIIQNSSEDSKVYGEVWYEVDIFYPYSLYSKNKTNKKKNLYRIHFFDHDYALFNFNPFYDKIIIEKTIVDMCPFPLRISYSKEEEVDDSSVLDVLDMAYINALEYVTNKFDKVISYNVLEKRLEKDGVRLKIFLSVLKDIGVKEKVYEGDSY